MSVGDRVEGAPPGWLVWTSVLIGVAVIAAVDYLSGVQLRVFPLYYIPISFVAWHRGWAGALAVSALCAASWFVSNVQASPQFTYASIWVANTVVQGVSFAIVGLLIATLRVSLQRERSLSRTDLSARLGGDEFAILLPEAGADEAGATLERLRLLLADTFAAMAVPVTVSVGAVLRRSAGRPRTDGAAGGRVHV